MPLGRYLTIIAAVAVVGWPASADILYVDDDAPPGGDGLSWQSAYRSLQVALHAARLPGATVTEVRVAQGTYRLVQQPPGPESTCCEVHETPGCNAPTCQAIVCLYFPQCCDTAWEEVCVQLAEVACDGLCDEQPVPPPPTYDLPDGLALRGGFAGVGAPDPDARDVEAYPTVLDGDVGHDDDLYPESCCSPHDTPGCDDPSPDGACEAAVCAELPYCCETAWDLLCVAEAINPYGGCSLDVACPEMTNNAQVVTAAEAGPGTVLDGVTVTHGAPGAYVEGGGPNLVDCTFIDNRHYGAWFYEGSPSITRCTFSDNAAYPLLLYDSAGTVTDCVMTGNASVGSGGGLYAIGSNTIAGCTISGNRASYGAGGVYVEGGTVVGCTISNNKSGPGWAGGGGEIDGADVIDCRFSSNESAAGGGLYVSSPGTTLTGCTFEGNTALSTGGGGVWCRDFDDLPTHLTQFVNCLFIGNAGEEGGGLLTWGWSPIVLVNCTFSGNAAASGGAVYFDDHQDSNMINCVLWGDIPDEIGGWSDPGNAAAFSDVQGGYPGPGNIDADPLFVDPAAGDYRLGPGSPCIDAGRSQMIGFASTSFRPGLCDQSDLDHDGDTHELIPVDREGQARFADDPDTPDTGCAAGPVVDMGAYEFGDSPPGQRVLHADLDGDGEVGVADFLIVLGMWGPCADPCCLADLATHYDDCRTINTPDGDVDVGDFYALLSWWGF